MGRPVLVSACRTAIGKFQGSLASFTSPQLGGLVVKEALMVEPTETETRETLDAFADAMLRIAEEVRTQPELLRDAPHATPVSRLDELRAARVPVLRWKPGPV